MKRLWLRYGTIGYQTINDKFMLDVFFGGGNQQGFYKGYLLANVMKLLRME
jgi:hypothetical protein